jgi:hypothetical protein
MNPYLASDLANPEFVNPMNPDDLAIVHFYNNDKVLNAYQSEIQGRPVFDTVVFVKIQFPGDTLAINDRPATNYDKVRWPRHWARFEKGMAGGSVEGTPLENWPLLRGNQVNELKAIGFHTVDQIGGASDQQLARIGMIAGMSAIALRDAAIRFLAIAKDAGMLEQQMAMNKRLEAAMAAQQKQIEEQQRRLDEALALVDNATKPKAKAA